MKNNITLKMEPFEISDEEIREYMDFEGVLHNHQKGGFSWKYLLAVAVVLSFSGGLFFILTDIEKSAPNDSASNMEHIPEENMDDQNFSPLIDSTHTTESKNPVLKEKEIIPDSKNVPPSSPKEEIPAPVKNDNTKSPEQEPDEMVFTQAEPGQGMTALYEYFDENLNYPESQLGSGVEGKTLVIFTVFKDGSVGQIVFESTLGQDFDKEAIRVLENMPLWKPARLNGEAVDSKISIPLYFEEK
jgi:hypothetical protein